VDESDFETASGSIRSDAAVAGDVDSVGVRTIVVVTVGDCHGAHGT
jgi:hypothetical protein